MILAIGISYLNPSLDLFRSHGTAAETRESLHALEAENERLKERSDSLMETSTLAREARRQGMVVPGEQAYVIRDLGS